MTPNPFDSFAEIILAILASCATAAIASGTVWIVVQVGLDIHADFVELPVTDCQMVEEP